MKKVLFLTMTLLAAFTLAAAPTATLTAEPTITVTPTNLVIRTFVGEMGTETFTVKGTNLVDDITLTLTDGYNAFAISPTSISASDAENGKEVTVTYVPRDPYYLTATVTCSSTGAQDVVVELTGSATPRPITPVMLETNYDYVTTTSFRAEWTNESPEEFVESYTLYVEQENVAGTYRTISGITDLYCVVEDLTPGATYYYYVRAQYVDGERSDWSNTEVVTLVGGELGDVNGDGVVDITDVTALIDRVLNDAPMDGCSDINGDINGDGTIDITDVTALIDQVLGGESN